MDFKELEFLLAIIGGLLANVQAQENVITWKCDDSTKDIQCVYLKASDVCYYDSDTEEYIPCYRKCNNLQGRIYIEACEISCKGYLERYCTNNTASTSLPSISVGTIRTSSATRPVPIRNRSSVIEPSEKSTSFNKNYHLFFFLLVPLVSILLGALVKEYAVRRNLRSTTVGSVSNPVAVTIPGDNAQGQESFEMQRHLINAVQEVGDSGQDAAHCRSMETEMLPEQAEAISLVPD